MRHNLLLVVPAASIAAANGLAASIDPGAASSFAANCSASGASPATHAFVAPNCSAATFAAVLGAFGAVPGALAVELVDEDADVDLALALLGFKRVVPTPGS